MIRQTPIFASFAVYKIVGFKYTELKTPEAPNKACIVADPINLQCIF